MTDNRVISTEEDLSLPVLEERLHVDIRRKTTGTIRLEKTVRQYEGRVDQELQAEKFSVECVSLNQYIEEPAVPRQEGDVTIFPVMEEILIVKKQLVLKEEIRVTRHRTQSRYQESVPLRVEEISIERMPAAQS